MQAAYREAAVEVWATDEHRTGLKPMLRRVWAPRGKRPVVSIHPRSRWRYLSGDVHPASGRTQWRLSSSINVERFTHALAAFAQPVGAGPTKQIVLVLDRAGWHMSRRVALPAHRHLAPLPPDTPVLQPAERLWSFSNTALVLLQHAAGQRAAGRSRRTGCAPTRSLRGAADRFGAHRDHTVGDSLSLVTCRLFSNNLRSFGITLDNRPDAPHTLIERSIK